MSARPCSYCETHDCWYAPSCPFCAAAAQIRELRAIVQTLEARVADLEAQAAHDRRRIYPLEARLSDQ